MRMALLETVLEVLVVVVYAALGGALTLGGLLIEYRGMLFAQAGESLLALWVAVLGGVALYLAYLLFDEKFIPALRRIRA